MTREEVIQKFIDNPKYMTNGAGALSKKWNCTIKDVNIARLHVRSIGNKIKEKVIVEKNNIENILVIGDIHLPFELTNYLNFCKETYKKYECNKVIFIGDIIDNHYSSYHETDANGMGGLQELELAIDKVEAWYKAFPVADVIIGNHDRIIMRKAQSSAIPTKWIREYKEVLGTPKWNFTESVTYNDVLYVHGEGGTARSRMKKDLQSVVQGHLHTQAYTEWLVGRNIKIFGMQVGCGIEHKSYAMAYAKNYGKPAIGCGVILDNGKQPINVLMDL
jgi:metallophosphoesterase superfamily enzyme